MTAKTSAGSTLAICATLPGTFNQAGFEALSWVEIGEVTNIPSFGGRVYNKVEHKPLKTRGTQKFKGGFDSGNATIDLAIDRDDAGQDLALTARDDDADYAFKLTEQDGAVIYKIGKVMSFVVNPGNTESITAGQIAIEFTTDAAGEDEVIVEA